MRLLPLNGHRMVIEWSWLIIVIIIMGIVIILIITIVISLVRLELRASPLRGLFARPGPSQARVRCAFSEFGAVRAPVERTVASCPLLSIVIRTSRTEK